MSAVIRLVEKLLLCREYLLRAKSEHCCFSKNSEALQLGTVTDCWFPRELRGTALPITSAGRF